MNHLLYNHISLGWREIVDFFFPEDDVTSGAHSLSHVHIGSLLLQTFTKLSVLVDNKMPQ